MNEIRECVKELFEIAGRDYFLAKAILERSNLYFDYFEIEAYFKSRNKYTQLFVELALDHINEGSLKKKELLKNAKAIASMRSNSCIYLLVKNIELGVTAEEYIFMQESHAWPCISEMLSENIEKVKLSPSDFEFLINTYCSKRGTAQEFAKRLLLLLPKTAIPFEFIDSNKLNSSFYLGVICRRLLLVHYGDTLANDTLTRMLRKDSGSNRDAYISEFTKRIENGKLPKSFWEKYMRSGVYELQVLALSSILEYPLDETTKTEIAKFKVKYNF